jgi:hypothetical protein
MTHIAERMTLKAVRHALCPIAHYQIRTDTYKSVLLLPGALNSLHFIELHKKRISLRNISGQDGAAFADS